MYADVDRDGVLDRVAVVDSSAGGSLAGGAGAEAEDDEGSNDNLAWLADRTSRMDGGAVPPCYALVTSGVPPVEQIFNGSLCHDGGALEFSSDDASKEKRNDKTPINIEGATPFVDEKEGNSLFFAVNNGVVTRYSALGKLMWQQSSGPTWEIIDPDASGCSDRVGGAVLSFLRGSTLLVTGEDRLVAFDKLSGSELGALVFPQDAASVPIVCDLNGDGVDDILIITADAVWGYLTHVNSSTTLERIVIFGVLFGMLVFVFMSEKGWLAEETTRGSSLRSTDLTSEETARASARYYTDDK